MTDQHDIEQPADDELTPQDEAPPVEELSSALAESVRHETDEPEADAAPTPEPEPVDTEPAEVPVTPKSILEAMLFVGGEGLAVDRAATLIGKVTPTEVREMVAELNDTYGEDGVPLEILDEANGLVMQITDQYLPVVRRLYAKRRQTGLSKAALETLALVAYRQPIARQDIDDVRGSASGALIRSLIGRGLVRVVGRAEGGGRAAEYGTTQRFLEEFNLTAVEDLPHIRDLDRL